MQIDTGSLALSGGRIEDNRALQNGGAFYNSSGQVALTQTVIISNAAETGGGGAIRNQNAGATLHIVQAQFISNTAAGNGGALLQINGQVYFAQSTLADNQAASGGAIRINNGTLALVNSTVSGNIASASDGGSALYTRNSSVTLTNTTIVSNTGNSLFQSRSSPTSGTTYVHNTIIANTIGGADCVSALTSYGYNLASDGSCTDLTNTGDIKDANPRLAPLADYGGDSPTQALLPDSPALDAIPVVSGSCDDSGVTADQRGVDRPQGSGCDIGAYESQGFTLTLSGDNNQSALVDSVFAQPLQVTLIFSGTNLGTPGQLITFTAPAVGAGLANTVYTATTSSSGTASVSVTANSLAGAYVVTATAQGVANAVSFNLENYIQHTLNTMTAGDGSGTIVLNPSGGVYRAGTVVTLTATAALGSTFAGWSGDAAGSTNPITLTIDANKVVTATFTQNQYSLTTHTVGSGSAVNSRTRRPTSMATW